MTSAGAREAPGRRVHGRARGRPLGPNRQALVDRLLPALELDPRAGGIDPGRAFGRRRAGIWLEVGFGAGEHLAWQAGHNPDIGLIGCEPYLQGVARLLSEIDAQGLDNIRLYLDDAGGLIAALPEASLGRCFVLFPDPWPKRRHHKRRFVTAENLDLLARTLTDGAELRFATDHMGYARRVLALAARHPAFDWPATRARDWRTKPADWPRTRYEAKARAAGREILYLRFIRAPRAAQRS